MVAKVNVTGIGVWAGERISLDRAASDCSADVINLLKGDGFVSFRRSDRTIADMAIAAIQDCLATSTVKPGDIDTVIFATESLGETNPTELRDALLAGLLESGVHPTQILGCWMNECANFVHALGLARAFVVAGTSRNVLVITSDRATDTSPRVMTNGGAVMSDVAGCLLIGNEGSGPNLRHVLTQFSSDIFAAERDADIQRKTKAMMTALASFTERIETVTGKSISDYPLVLTDNLHSLYLDLICNGLRLPRDRTAQLSKPDFAHGFSVEGLLGLKLLLATGDIPSDGPVAILTVIPWSFGFAVFEPPFPPI